MVYLFHKGSDFTKAIEYFKKNSNVLRQIKLDKFGEMGVDALRSATPVDTGKTADSWRYEISDENGKLGINWYNSNVNDGVNIAVIIQYGHGTRQGAYVQGLDYINPALKPVFDEIADAVWKEVINT